jgi:hypothetical protein
VFLHAPGAAAFDGFRRICSRHSVAPTVGGSGLCRKPVDELRSPRFGCLRYRGRTPSGHSRSRQRATPPRCASRDRAPRRLAGSRAGTSPAFLRRRWRSCARSGRLAVCGVVHRVADRLLATGPPPGSKSPLAQRWPDRQISRSWTRAPGGRTSLAGPHGCQTPMGLIVGPDLLAIPRRRADASWLDSWEAPPSAAIPQAACRSWACGGARPADPRACLGACRDLRSSNAAAICPRRHCLQASESAPSGGGLGECRLRRRGSRAGRGRGRGGPAGRPRPSTREARSPWGCP